MIFCGTIGAYAAAVYIRSAISRSLRSSWACIRTPSIMAWSVAASGSLTLTPPVATWMAISSELSMAAAQTRSNSGDE